MQSPNLFSNEHNMDIEFVKQERSSIIIPSSNVEHLRKVINDNKITEHEEDDESKIAALEERTRQLLIELQVKRNDANVTQSKQKVESGWAERERNAVMRAEAADNRAQCAMAAAYRLAEERETLNRIVTETRGKYDIMAKENELLTSKIRQISVEVLTHERKEKEAMAEKLSFVATKRNLYEKMEVMKNSLDDVNKWISSSNETMQVFRGELEAMKTLESKMKEESSIKDAIILDLKNKLNDATTTIANLAAKIGILEARNELLTTTL